MTPNIFAPVRNPPVRRKRKSVAGPAAVPQVLVESVVVQGIGAVMVFSRPVTLNELGPEETIRFSNGPQSGFAEDLSQVAPDAIYINGAPGVTIAPGVQWEILAVPPCLDLPEGSVMPVPQSGAVE